MWAFIVTVFDATSQLAGRFIPAYYDGKIRHYTRTANESISGASNWHADNDRWPWAEAIIDAAFLVGSLGKERNHCLRARINDRSRAAKLLASDKPEREL